MISIQLYPLFGTNMKDRTDHAMIVIMNLLTRHYISLTMVCGLEEMVSSLFKLK